VQEDSGCDCVSIRTSDESLFAGLAEWLPGHRPGTREGAPASGVGVQRRGPSGGL